MNASILITIVSIFVLSGCGKPAEMAPIDGAQTEKFITEHLSGNPDDLVGKDGKPVHFEMAADERYKLSQNLLEKRAASAGKNYAQSTVSEKMDLILASVQDPATPREALRSLFDVALILRLQTAPVSAEESAQTEGTRFNRHSLSTQILKEICEKLNLASYWAVPINFEIAQSNRDSLKTAE
jgi:hypothetical protein